jgi:hypothetical protein
MYASQINNDDDNIQQGLEAVFGDKDIHSSSNVVRKRWETSI